MRSFVDDGGNSEGGSRGGGEGENKTGGLLGGIFDYHTLIFDGLIPSNSLGLEFLATCFP